MKPKFVIECAKCGTVYSPNPDKECPFCGMTGGGKFLFAKRIVESYTSFDKLQAMEDWEEKRRFYEGEG